MGLIRGSVRNQSPPDYATGFRVNTLFEVNYAEQVPYTFTHNVAKTICGLTYWNSQSNGSTAIIDNRGLTITMPAAAVENNVYVLESSNGAGNGKGIKWIVGNERHRRGMWGAWIRTTDVNLVGTQYIYNLFFDLGYPNWGVGNSKCRNTWGAGNVAHGQWVGWNWNDSTHIPAKLFNTATDANLPDVSMLFFRSPWEIEHYYGTWTNGTWPTFEAMTLGGVTRMRNSRICNTVALGIAGGDLTNMTMSVGSGGMGVVTTGNSSYTTTERYRITAFDF